MPEKYTISWRDDLNWRFAHFRVIAESFEEAIMLGTKLSGKPRSSISVRSESKVHGDQYLPLWNGREFVYPCVTVYVDRPSTSKICINGRWFARTKVLV